MWAVDTGFHADRVACGEALMRLSQRQFAGKHCPDDGGRGATPRNLYQAYCALAEPAPADARAFWCYCYGGPDGWTVKVHWATPGHEAQQVRHLA